MRPDHRESLSLQLPGTWQLESRIDVTASGEHRLEPLLGEDPIAHLGNTLVIEVRTTSADGVDVTRTLTWRRVG